MELNRINFIIIGAQKGGTTAAAYNLNMHPGISVFSGKTEYGQLEIEFFNQHWDRGIQWYFDQLPKSIGLIGEKTAELLHRSICHQRIFETQPNVKLIVLLRCPIERAYSQWRMASFNKKDEPRSFHEAILHELKLLETPTYKDDFSLCVHKGISSWREGYLLKGFYHEQLTNLFRYFSKQNIHIAISEYVARNKKEEYAKMFSFLNLHPFNSIFEERFVGKAYDSIDKKTYQLLKNIYSSQNNKLFNMLDYEIPEWC